MKNLQEVIKELNKKDDEFIELLIKNKPYDDIQEKIFNYLKRDKAVMKVYKFKTIPYISVKMTTNRAKEMIKSIINRNESVKSEEARIMEMIDDIETSHKVKIKSKSMNEIIRKEFSNIQLWGMTAIHRKEAQGLNPDLGAYSKIGVIDTGVDYTHKEIMNNFGEFKGYNFIDENNNPMDKNGHGTHVAGTISGSTVGVAPKTRLYALRVLDENGSGSEADVMRAIEWSINNEYDIKLDAVNLSLGSPEASDAFREICKTAISRGLIIVAAAGNEEFGYEYPAAFDDVISVAAINEDREHAYFSNIADTNKISAPGVDIISSFPNNQYAMLSGTSMATPHVTGTIALIKGLNNQNIEDVLKESSERLKNTTEWPNKSVFGYGLLRADNISRLIEEGNYNKSIEQAFYESIQSIINNIKVSS